MKKILALVLALIMVMGLATTAFAANPDSLTTGNASTDGHEVKVTYKAGENGGVIYKVDIAWGSLEFKYTSLAKGTWNPSTHQYDNAAAAKWENEEGANKITVTNHSNAAVDAELTYAKKDGYESVNGAFDNATLKLITAEGTDVAAAPTDSALLSMSGDLADTTTGTVTVGTVTVTLK